MDIMKLKSKIMTGIANKILRKMVYDAIGVNADFDVQQVVLSHEEDKTTGHLELNFKFDDSELAVILRNMGL